MNKIKRWLNTRSANKLARQFIATGAIEQATRKTRDKIPVLVISFNNAPYVLNTVKQLNDRHVVPIVIDNNSTDPKSIQAINSINIDQAIVLHSEKNLGHLVGFLDPIYKLLPETFAYTDPDLQYNSDLPEDFLLQLADTAELYKCYKAGMALDIFNAGEIRDIYSSTIRKYPFKFERLHSVLDWEDQYWNMPLKHERLEVYAASLDTTFAVYQKRYFNGDFSKGVRVAGEFTAVHLPWFKHLDVLSEEDRTKYANSSKFSTWIKQ